MTEIIIIAAVAENGVIGKDNQIPWHFSEDLLRFKRLTMGHPIIMGRKTWDSLGHKPLPGRKNIVLTTQKQYQQENCTIHHSLGEAIASCKDSDKIYIIGGSSIYREGLKIANTLELTRINKKVDGDTLFPEIDFDCWQQVKEEKMGEFSFLTYARKTA